MSKHIFTSVHNGESVVVEMGWDQPLGYFFMQVTSSGAVQQKQARTDIRCLYSNLSDSALNGGAKDPNYYWAKLREMGIRCPYMSEIGAELQLDATCGGNNRIVRYGLKSN